jgi:hypothetical protein
MSLEVNTQIVESVAIPEYVKPAAGSNAGNEYRKMFTDLENSIFHPDAKVQDDNESSLKERTQTFEGFADENMPDISRSNVSGTEKIESFVKSKL